mgnify:CR=1 FL=1
MGCSRDFAPWIIGLHVGRFCEAWRAGCYESGFSGRGAA